jgi:hypothetical protein
MKVQIGCHAVRNFQKQAEPIAFMLQLLLPDVTLNRDSRNVAGILDQMKIGGTRATSFTIEDREGAEDLTFASE